MEIVLTARQISGYRLRSPDGEVRLLSHHQSITVHRVMGLCAYGVLPEFVKTYRLNNCCHATAFEFASAVGRLPDELRTSATFVASDTWRWCVARRAVTGGDVHSWIEQSMDDEAFDAVRGSTDTDPYIYVRPRRQLWQDYQVEGVESRSFDDVATWLARGEDYPLFTKYL